MIAGAIAELQLWLDQYEIAYRAVLRSRGRAAASSYASSSPTTLWPKPSSENLRAELGEKGPAGRLTSPPNISAQAAASLSILNSRQNVAVSSSVVHRKTSVRMRRLSGL
jgi:hypothetical protein